MKNTKFGRICLALAVIIIIGAMMPSCGVRPIESTEEEAAVIGTIGDYEVRYEELRYLVLNHKTDMALKYGEDIWTDKAKAETYREELQRLVNESIISDYYAIQAMADTLYLGGGASGMMSDPNIQELVQKTVEEVVDECGSFSKYKKMLKEQYMTDSLFRFYCTAEECATELFYILAQDLGIIESSEEYITDYMHSDDFLRTNHIFIKGVTEENRALAETLRKQIYDSDNMEIEIIMLKSRYCADYTMTTTHGKYFARYTSDYGDEYELAAFDLNKGGLSEVVETPEGFYIILRLDIEEDYIKENYEEFKDDIMGSEFNKDLARYKDMLSFTMNDYGKSIDILEIE